MTTRNLVTAMDNQKDYASASKHELTIREMHTTWTHLETNEDSIVFAVTKTVPNRTNNKAYDGIKLAESGDFAYTRVTIVAFTNNGIVKEQLGVFYGSATTRKVARVGQKWLNPDLVKAGLKATVVHLAHMAKPRFGFDETKRTKYAEIVANYKIAGKITAHDLEDVEVDMEAMENDFKDAEFVK